MRVGLARFIRPRSRRRGAWRTQRAQIRDDVDELLNGHRVAIGRHPRGPIGGFVPLARLNDRARVDDRLDEVLRLMERSHTGQLGTERLARARAGELLALHRMAAVALESD